LEGDGLSVQQVTRRRR